MLTQHYSSQQRRGLNQVWTAAGEYDFEPLFLSMGKDREPELYMNSIVGYVHKWYGEEMPRALFAAWEGDRRQATLDDLAWLALESAAFQREVVEREVLAELRTAYAENFFAQEYDLSRQEWMAKNQLVYTIASARWKKVLGRRLPVMLPHERRLAEALECSGELSAQALAQSILDTFARFGLFRGKVRNGGMARFHLKGRLAGAMTRLMPGEITHTDVASVSAAAAGRGGGAQSALDPRRAQLRLMEKGEADRQYIESCFGRSLYPLQELKMAEQQLCTGIHQGCHLWFTAGVPQPETAQGREAKLLAEEARRQYERNREAFTQNAGLYQNAILRLSEQIRNCLQVHSEVERETARSGVLEAQRVWRAAVLEDARVFLREAETNRPGFSVELLLDASASRQHCQEVIAAQGYILAESLSRCGIKVRVSGFCSLRGYTVLRVLKEFSDKSSQKIFRYFATGWNRDGLAIRALGELIRRSGPGRRLVILLTDASPNDSHRIPPGGKYPLGRDYADAPAVADAAEEVRAMRSRGIRLAAVYMGPTQNVPDAEMIYGRSLGRIHSMDQLAGAAGRLIRDEIRELEE